MMDDQVQFGGECWLLVRHSPKILSPFIGGLVDAKVSALIDQEHKTWKEEVIDANLLSFEAAMFKKKIHYTTWIRPIHSLGHSTTWGNT